LNLEYQANRAIRYTPSTVYRVYVTNLEFYAFHGVPAEERKIGHRYRISIDVDVMGDATETDHVQGTVDYAQLAQTVEFVSSSNQYQTLERLGAAIGQAVLSHFDRVQAVRLRLEKRLPPAEMMAEAAGVEMEIRRPSPSVS